MSRPSSLAWVLMLLLSRVAGDIGSSEKHSLNSSTELPSVLETLTPVTDVTSDELQRSLRFEPPLVDFGEACPVGTARAYTVTLLNQNVNRSVYLTSVSGRTPMFYSSFFEAKVVPPQGNTTFNVVFLPRMHGIVATDLLIHTSFGQARLQVRGKGRDCPYRLKPLVGIKAPLNATLTPEIQMYNPHSKPLQILEVYSSGGLFQLELPSGGQEGPQTLWEIPPYETKSVIRIRFHARTVGNHTAYIRIKISNQVEEGIGDTVGTGGNVLVIPVEFEILPLHGLYADNPVINFGRFSTKDGEDLIRDSSVKPIQFKLHLHSSHMRQQYELLDFTLRNISGLTFDPKDGVVILEADAFDSTTILDELMTIKSVPREPLQDSVTQSTQEFTILIRAELFKGSLHYDSNSTTFITQATLGTRGGNKRTLVLRNDYETPLALLNVSLPQEDIGSQALRAQFSSDYLDAIADGASGSLVLPAGGSLALLQLQMINSSMTYKASLHVSTNITHIKVPLVVCGGRLHVSTYDTARIQADGPYNVDLNLGAIPLAETSHDGYIVLRNRNPLPVKLTTWNFQSPQGVYFHTTFRGCLRPSSLRALRNATLKLESAKFKLCTQLEEDDVAVFQVTIQSYITEQHQCTLKIWTAYEEITTTVRFRTWIGKLEVDQEQLYFNNCFPGKQCSAELAIRSTFQHSIHITSINFTDAGLHFQDYNVNGSTIEGNAMTKVGRIHVNPSLFCQNRCYIQQDGRTNSLAFPAPSNTRGGLNNNLHFDETELRRRTELFRHLKYDFQNIVFTLNSHELRRFLLQLIIDIEWPKFVTEKPVLPTIEVGKSHEVQVLLSNPADTPVLIDYFLADPLYAKETQLSLPLEVVDIVPHCYLTDKEVFSLPRGAPRQPVLLHPHASLPVTVRLKAPVADSYCTLLHIRNNLTLYEAVWVSAKVVESDFRLGNRKPGSNVSLTFNFTEKHFSICNPSSTHQHTLSSHNGVRAIKYPLLKRKFTARNTGEIPIWIETFQIGDQICSGYGFKIVDCNSFALKANETKKIEIIFTPDFTMNRIMVPLKIHTNLSYNVEYTIVAQLPPGTIDQCSVLIERPPWEERIRNTAIVVLATTFVFVLIAAHIDYDNILHSQTALYEARDKGSVHPTFNLRNIALKAQAATHATEDEPQTVSRSAANVQQTRCGANHPQQPKGSTSSSSSSSGSSGSSGTGNNGVKKRSFKRQNHLSGNAASSRVSLPWSLDLNVFKSSVPPTKPTSDSDKTNPSSGINGGYPTSGNENSGKKSSSALTQPKSNTHSDKLDRSNSGGSTNNSNTAGKKQQTQVSTTQPQVQTSPPKQQQPRGARKSKNTVTVSVQIGEKTDKEPQIVAAVNQKAQGNNPGSTKNTRSNTNKSNVGEAMNHINVKSNVPDIPSSTVPISIPSPSIKDVGAQSSATGAKYGKTPGRERRKDVQNASSTNIGNDVAVSNCPSSSANASRRAERRSRQRAANALRTLNFGDASITAGAATRTRPTNGNDNGGLGGGGAAGGMGGLMGCLSSPWDTCSQATFSDVLQAQPISVLTKNASKANDKCNLDISDSKSAFFFVDKEKGMTEHESDFTSKEVQQQTQPFGQTSGDSALDKAALTNSTELGPIGSKKSPSSTPVWEPVNSSSSSSGSSNHSGNGLQIPKPIVSTGDCSFFSDLLTTYEYDGNSQLRGMDAELYEIKKARNEYFEYIYNLRQQQLQAQVQAHVQAQQQHQQQQQLMQGVDWARLNSRTWSPMAYLGQHDTPSLNSAALPTTVTNASPCAALISGLSAPVVGGSNTGTTSWPIGAALSSTSSVVNGSGGPTIIRPPPGLESNFQGINNNTQTMTQPQQQSLNVSSTDTGATITADMQTFDPFSSLSSIWSDSWQKRDNSNNSNTNNGNMK
uniref:Transmembrane protein 131-like protein n=2 Tax=Bactrocera dorsalis TaxID=27457 RepID=A0A034VX70_BACDO